MKIKNIKIACVVVLGLLLVLNVFNLHSSISDDMHTLAVDESSHLYNTYYYKLFFVDRNFESPEWSSFAFYDQPPVAKYVLGSALHLVNGTLIDNSVGAKDWHRRALGDFWIPRLEEIRDDRAYDPAFAQRAGLLAERGSALLEETETSQPIYRFTEQDVAIGRLVVFVFEILSAAVLVAAVWYVTRNIAAGLLAGLLFVSNPLTIPVFQEVYTDSLWCFFVLVSVLGLFALLKHIQKGRTRKAIAYSVVIGLSLALAIGTKLIAVYMALVVMLVLILNAVLHIVSGRTQELDSVRTVAKTSAVSLVLVSISSVFLFVALNPFLYNDIVSNILKMFEHRQVIMEMQLMTQGPVVETVSERIRALVRFGILSGYDTKGVLGLNLVFGYACVLLVGLVRMCRKAKREVQLGAVGPYAAVTILSLASYLFVGLTVHMEWERYFLPLLLCNVFWFAFGTDAIIRFCVRSK